MSTSIYDIKDTLGESSYSLQGLCTSNNINKWSFYKPINSNKIDTLSNNDFYDVNDGFILSIYSSPQQMVYALQNANNTNLWAYDDRDAPYRLLDFEGYNHYAESMFNLEFTGSDTVKVGDAVRMACTDDLEEMITKWKYFYGAQTDIDVVALFYPEGTQYDDAVTKGIHIYRIKNIIDSIDSDKLNFIVPNGIANGNYEVRICMSTATVDMQNDYIYYAPGSTPLIGLWYALPPHAKLTFTVSTQGGGGSSSDLFDDVNFTFANMTYSFSEPYLSNISFDVITSLISNNGTYIIGGDLYYDNTLSQRPVYLGSISATLTAGGITSKTSHVNYNDIITVGPSRLDEGRISIRIKATIRKSGMYAQKEWTENIEI